MGIHIWHPGVLCGHGSKMEIGVERLKQRNIELRATFFCIFGRQIVLELSHVHFSCHYDGTSMCLGWTWEQGAGRCQKILLYFCFWTTNWSIIGRISTIGVLVRLLGIQILHPGVFSRHRSKYEVGDEGLKYRNIEPTTTIVVNYEFLNDKPTKNGLIPLKMSLWCIWVSIWDIDMSWLIMRTRWKLVLSTPCSDDHPRYVDVP